MATEVKLPNLGDGVDTGDVLELLVKEGDVVAKDQGILEIETGKATKQGPSPGRGTAAVWQPAPPCAASPARWVSICRASPAAEQAAGLLATTCSPSCDKPARQQQQGRKPPPPRPATPGVRFALRRCPKSAV